MRILGPLSLAIYVVLSLFAALHDRCPGDLAMTQGLQSLASPWLDQIMRGISFVGSRLVTVSIGFAVFAGLLVARRWRNALVIAASGVTPVIVPLLKNLIARPRPSGELVRVLEASASGSFPSGHAVGVVVLMGLIWAIFIVDLNRQPLRRTLLVLMALFVLFECMSRVYLGAHWPSDVLGGVLLGIAILWGLLALNRWLSHLPRVSGVLNAKSGDT